YSFMATLDQPIDTFCMVESRYSRRVRLYLWSVAELARRRYMAKLVAARAWCNNEVAYLGWKTDGKIDGCLGFMITRIHLDLNGQEVERRNLPTWGAFATQSNPKWEEQDTSVWPIQKFSWRDLTLRKSRNTLTTRPPASKAKY